MFIRSHLDYGDIVYDRAFNESFHKYLESIQYNAAIAITGAIRGTSSEKLFQELGLESLKSRRWLRKLCLFYKIFHKKSPSYLFQLIPPNNNVYATRSSQSNKILSFKTRHNFFKDSFFPAVISEWNSLNTNIRNSSSINVFKIAAWTKPFRWSQIQAQLSALCIHYVLFRSGYWNNNSHRLLLPQFSLYKENPLWKDKSSKWNHLKAKWFNNYKDIAVRW